MSGEGSHHAWYYQKDDLFRPTCRLRWAVRKSDPSTKQLQQLYEGPDGEKQWRKVEAEIVNY